MFASELKMNRVWLTIVLLLLCYSVSPHSCYPQSEEDEDPTAVDQNLDNEEDGGEADDEEEESSDEGEDSEVENSATIRNFNAEETCVTPGGRCDPENNPRGLLCCREVISRDFFRCDKWLTVGNYWMCTRIRPEAVQNWLKALAVQAGLP